jgi:hypothetical protein
VEYPESVPLNSLDVFVAIREPFYGLGYISNCEKFIHQAHTTRAVK